MKLRHIGMAGLAVGCLTATPLAAQIPGFGAGGAPVAPAPAAAAAVAAPGNLWSFLCPTPEQTEACRQKLCASPIGQLLNGGLKPIGALSGGVVGPFCRDNLAPGLAKSPESVGGAAARVKKDAAEAKQRIADVRYLANVDCHYWPEAQAALINALRADRVECVRYEAALALTHGCCCTKEVVKALTVAVNCGDGDGNPRENSERVRAQAAVALENCLAKCPDLLAEEPAKTEIRKEEPKKEEPRREGAAAKPNLAEEARSALAKKPAAPARRGGSLFEILAADPAPAPIAVNRLAQAKPAAPFLAAATPISAPVAVATPIFAPVETAPPAEVPALLVSQVRETAVPAAALRPAFHGAAGGNAGYSEVCTLQASDSRDERLAALKTLAGKAVRRVDLVQSVVNVSCTDGDAEVRLAAFRILPALGVPAPAVEQVARRLILDADEQIREAGRAYLKTDAK